MYRPPVLLIKSPVPARFLSLRNAHDKKDLTRVPVVAPKPVCNHYVYFPNLNPLPCPLLQLIPGQRLAFAQR